MAKPAKKAYSLEEIAAEWSKLWKDSVTEDDVLGYARDELLVIQTLVARERFEVLNRNELPNLNVIAEDGTTWIFNFFVPVEPKWANVLLQGQEIPVVNLRFIDMNLRPIGGILQFGRNDVYVLHEDKIKFEREAGIIANDRQGRVSDNSLLITLAAFMALWPSGKLPSGKELEKGAASIGLSISDDAIRNALNAAKDLAPDLKKPAY